MLVLAEATESARTLSYRELVDGGSVTGLSVGSGGLGFMYGIVPDGVSSVAMLFEDNSEIAVQVPANFFSIEIPPSHAHGQATFVWRDVGGHTLKTFPGQPLGQPPIPVVPSLPPI